MLICWCNSRFVSLDLTPKLHFRQGARTNSKELQIADKERWGQYRCSHSNTCAFLFFLSCRALSANDWIYSHSYEVYVSKEGINIWQNHKRRFPKCLPLCKFFLCCFFCTTKINDKLNQYPPHLFTSVDIHELILETFNSCFSFLFKRKYYE